MTIVTTSFDGTPIRKPFAWSYSRLKNFESCPKRHYEVDIAKNVREEEGESLQWGNAVHKGLANTISKGDPLPTGMGHFQKWVDRIVTGQGNILVEQQLAIDEDFGPTKWFESDAKRAGLKSPWYRGIGDVVKLVAPVALIIDWKTGKILEDAPQLALMAACVFAHHPEIKKVRSEFVWLKEDATTRGDFDRNEMATVWKDLWPRIEALKHAHETTTYPAKPGRLCRRFCPVTACPHHGESN